jgi:hypothetical protein
MYFWNLIEILQHSLLMMAFFLWRQKFLAVALSTIRQKRYGEWASTKSFKYLMVMAFSGVRILMPFQIGRGI